MAGEISLVNGHAATQSASLMPQIMESVLLLGDLSKLTPRQRVEYYGVVCESAGLNPLTKPLDYIYLQNRLTLYANKNCAEQLRRRDSISLAISCRELLGSVYVVTARASTPTGRFDESTGAVCIDKLTGENLANSYMKAETKAKRRVTLSICGLGILDESEVDSIAGARRVAVDVSTGEIDTAGIDTGSHAPGTQAAADHVAQRRIAELRDKGAPQLEAMRRSLQEIITTIGDEAAGVILQNHDIQRVEQVMDIEVGRRIFREMRGYARSVRKSVN